MQDDHSNDHVTIARESIHSFAASRTSDPPLTADLAALDRLDDEVLWRIARSRQTEADMERYQELLDKNANGVLLAEERDELVRLRVESDRSMLCKAHAAALLRWRGYQVPPAETLLDAALILKRARSTWREA